MLENIFEGTRATVEGTYAVADGKLSMTPSKTNVEGQGPEADRIRSVINQPSRVTLIMKTPNDFQLGTQVPPLMVHRLSANP